MDNEITSIAKATEEVAKAERETVKALRGLGGFFDRVFGDLAKNAVGMVTDTVKFARAERVLRLEARFAQSLKERALEESPQYVPPKIALPAIENAVLEEEDELQDLWVNLLTSSLDPNLNGVVRSAFIDIIKQLEVVDVLTLNYVYTATTAQNLKYAKEWGTKYRRDLLRNPMNFGISRFSIANSLGILDGVQECAIDNLIRVRLLAHENENVTVGDDHDEWATHVNEYSVTLTTFGRSFVRACTMPNK